MGLQLVPGQDGLLDHQGEVHELPDYDVVKPPFSGGGIVDHSLELVTVAFSVLIPDDFLQGLGFAVFQGLGQLTLGVCAFRVGPRCFLAVDGRCVGGRNLRIFWCLFLWCLLPWRLFLWCLLPWRLFLWCLLLWCLLLWCLLLWCLLLWCLLLWCLLLWCLLLWCLLLWCLLLWRLLLWCLFLWCLLLWCLLLWCLFLWCLLLWCLLLWCLFLWCLLLWCLLLWRLVGQGRWLRRSRRLLFVNRRPALIVSYIVVQ